MLIDHIEALIRRTYPTPPRYGVFVRVRAPRRYRLAMAIGPLRYCQRCSKATTLYDTQQPSPCSTCGGTNFAAHPKPHVTGSAYHLTPDDVTFLRVQGINPEGY